MGCVGVRKGRVPWGLAGFINRVSFDAPAGQAHSRMRLVGFPGLKSWLTRTGEKRKPAEGKMTPQRRCTHECNAFRPKTKLNLHRNGTQKAFKWEPKQQKERSRAAPGHKKVGTRRLTCSPKALHSWVQCFWSKRWSKMQPKGYSQLAKLVRLHAEARVSHLLVLSTN